MPDACMSQDCSRRCSCYEHRDCRTRSTSHHNYCDESNNEEESRTRCESPRFKVMGKQELQESFMNECSCCCKVKPPPEPEKPGCEIPEPSSEEEDQIAVVREDPCEDEGARKLGLYVKMAIFLIMFAALSFLLYRFLQSYSKAHEIMIVMFLLLITLILFEPKHFIPSLVMNNIC
ncbi:hypothetical protein Bpfe_010458 [Biomphalaria pfeifferi]|uniref:Uncharacterized protein n=1 Tax=Biomphalaria pfeifferi TaxID=112525 RepID=A0AAD8BTD0_BIOPF|nr:hypothetical protein Bpfe_010458 [Biomphalaria pfeifferi]